MSSSDINSPYRGAVVSQRQSEQDDEEVANMTPGFEKFRKLPDEVQNELRVNFDKQYPANPLLPKTFVKVEDSPKFGGLTKFIKLLRFRGQDDGKSKFRQEAAKIEHIEFTEGTTIKKIFKPVPKKEDFNPFDSGVNSRQKNSFRGNERPDSNFSLNEHHQTGQAPSKAREVATAYG